MSGSAYYVGIGKCTYCGQTMVDAWVCIDCSVEISNRVEMRPCGAGAVSRGMQRLVDRAAHHEQLLDLQTLPDHNVQAHQERRRSSQGSSSNHARYERTRKRRNDERVVIKDFKDAKVPDFKFESEKYQPQPADRARRKAESLADPRYVLRRWLAVWGQIGRLVARGL